MPATIPDLSSILVIDVSQVEIQAHLFRKSEDFFFWSGVGRSTTNITGLGMLDGKCLIRAIQQVAKVTGYTLLDSDERIISPPDKNGNGIDRVCLSWSLPTPIKALLIGLIPAHSIKAGQLLATELPLTVMDQIYTTDGRTEEEKLDALLTNQLDVIIMCGGVEGGAEQVIKTQVDIVAHALSLLPLDLRPEILYAGNSHLKEYVKSKLESLTVFSISSNIQPTLKEYDIQPACEMLTTICNRIWLKRFGLLGGKSVFKVDIMRPVNKAIEDFSVIFEKSQKVGHGCIITQFNNLSAIITTSISGNVTSKKYGYGCLPDTPALAVEQFRLREVSPWYQGELGDLHLASHLIGQAFHPSRLPITAEDASLDSAITKVAGCKAWQQFSSKTDFPFPLKTKKNGVDTDVILLWGPRLHNLTHYGPLLLEMLDILQPIGIVDVFLDREETAAPLAIAGQLNPLVPIHCISAGVITKLATVIAPDFKSDEGVKAFSLILVAADGRQTFHEVRSGSLLSIPLAVDETTELRFTFHRRMKMGSRFSHFKKIFVTGGILGIVIDARGRPITSQRSLHAQQSWLKRSMEQAIRLDR